MAYPGAPLKPQQSVRHARAIMRDETARKRIEAQLETARLSENARQADAESCNRWRARMRPLLDAYCKTLSDSTDLAELRVWAFGSLTIVEEATSMKVLQQEWSELRMAFGHDSKTVRTKVIGSDFEERLARALSEHGELEEAVVVDVKPKRVVLQEGSPSA